MQLPQYNWSARSGALAVVLTVFAVAAYNLTGGGINAGFMIGYVTAIGATTVELLRTRHSISWTWFGFLNAAGMLVLVALATSGAFQLYHLAAG
jgi:hypothetical protein